MLMVVMDSNPFIGSQYWIMEPEQKTWTGGT